MRFTPLAVLSLVGAVSVLVSLYRDHDRTVQAKLNNAVALLSWFTLWWASSSSFAERAMRELPLHMISHIFVMFIVPIGLIYSGAGRKLGRWMFTSGQFPTSRFAKSQLNHPVIAFVFLNGVMVASHLPTVFNATMNSPWAMDWLMEPAFLLSGLFFFSFIVRGPGKSHEAKLRWQLLLVLGTMLEMLLMAMSMSIFTKVAWYPMMDSMAMMGKWHPTAHDFSQQQLAAAILWVCGDFWAVPCLVVIVRRIMARDGGLLAALERQSSRFS